MIHTDFALRRPVTTLMTFVAVSLVGIISAWLLPLELFPDIRFPGLQVRIPYSGSTPEEVEDLITRSAEEAIATLSGVREIRSTSSETGTELIVLFDWDRDPAAVGFEVRTKLESIRHQFPAAADRIQTNLFAAGDDRVVAIRISGREDLSRQYDMLERYLKQPLERIDGVARVSLEIRSSQDRHCRLRRAVRGFAFRRSRCYRHGGCAKQECNSHRHCPFHAR